MSMRRKLILRDETIDADVINDLPEPEIVQAGNVRKSSSKVIGFIKK